MSCDMVWQVWQGRVGSVTARNGKSRQVRYLVARFRNARLVVSSLGRNGKFWFVIVCCVEVMQGLAG